LSDSDIRTLADMIRAMVGPFSSVEGVPRGGQRLEQALRPFATIGPHLIVDDVLTTGRSMEKAKSDFAGAQHRLTEIQSLGLGIIGAVIFARGQLPYWIKALFKMPESLWVYRRS
jgi:hypothetical protein